ncbi:MAG: ABC transporter ATP-binding protein/permease [Puniceicoccales bacterium]|jgi:subfamily B ATP-binding cassette protein MsbA|nr:ABC transporter ATP-binding protein/permease [Puniceicoccales bacterium]
MEENSEQKVRESDSSSMRCGYRSMLRYVGDLRRCRWQIIGTLFFGILSGFLSGFGVPVLLKSVAQHVFSEEHQSCLLLIFYCALPIFLMGLRSISGYFSTCLLAFLGQKILMSVRLNIFQKLQRLPLAFFRRTQAGHLVSRALNDANLIQVSFVSIAHELIQRPAMLISAILAITYLCLQQANGWILLLLLFLVALSGFPIAYFGREVWNRNLRAQEKISDLTTRMTSNLQSVQEVRAFCMEEYENSRFRHTNCAYSKAYLATCFAYYFIVPSVEFWAAIGISIATFLAYLLHIPGETFLAIVMALFFSYDPIKNIGRLYGNLQYSISALSRIEELLAEPEKPKDTPGLPLVKKLRGEIVFENVSFTYEDGAAVFSDLNLSFQPGRSYAIVGPNGAGKTSLANLILRFYDVQKGIITVDGHDIKKLSLLQLRSSVALVPQQPTLLHDTVAANIRWGCPTATLDDVIQAAHRAGAMCFIEKLPRGLDTVIGEDGSFLSGGERQRLALARAFLKDAPILILDEATSALDTKSEREFYGVLSQLFRRKTVLLISHCFHWLPHVDEIIVLDGGFVVQRGAHAQLIQEDGLYRRLHQSFVK